MPSASTISIYDGQATPVAHDFEPLTVTPSQAVLVCKESDTAAGQMQIIAGFSPASANRSTDRVNLRFNMPVEYTVDGVTAVLHTARFNGDFVLPELLSQADRDNFAAYVANAVANAVLNGYISDRDPIY